jgi:hypothetical protein
MEEETVLGFLREMSRSCVWLMGSLTQGFLTMLCPLFDRILSYDPHPHGHTGNSALCTVADAAQKPNGGPSERWSYI